MMIKCVIHHTDIGLCGCDPDEQYREAQSHRTATEARERYETDPRYRMIAQNVVHEAMGEYEARNPYADFRAVHDLALNVAVILMERLFKEDSELRAQRMLADRYKKIAEDALALTNHPPVFVKGESQ